MSSDSQKRYWSPKFLGSLFFDLKLIKFIKTNIYKVVKLSRKLFNDLLKILSIKVSVGPKKNGPLKNKTFLLTGKLENMSRAEAKSLIEQNSGSIISNVSKKLDYLIIGEKPTKRKIESAKELKVKILSQEDWIKMLNNTS